MGGTPDLNLLPMFVAVAETWSMSDAARKLGIPKSSVSRGVSALEAALGVQLFHRTTRKLALTTAGTAFYERVRPVLVTLQEVAGSLPEQEAEPAGELRLTAPVDLALVWLAPLLAAFATRYPGIRLDVRPMNRLVDLVGEGFDVALRVSGRLADSSLVARRLSGMDMAVYAAPTYLARRGIPRTPGDAATHEWLAHPSTRMLPEPLASVTPRLASDDLLFIHRAIREGMGLGALPVFIARDDVARGRLVRVLPGLSFPTGNLYFVYPQTEHVPRKVAAFRDFVLAYLAANPLVSGESGPEQASPAP